MNDFVISPLTDRRLVRVEGEDARHFLNGLLTCNVEKMATGDAGFGALLTPQGKILFEFFVVATADGFLLDCLGSMADDLVRRLGFYKLRSKVTIGHAEPGMGVFAIWPGEGNDPASLSLDGVAVTDPRLDQMGLRAYLGNPPAGHPLASVADYHCKRIELGLPEGGSDYAFGDAFPHEVLMDRNSGVDFRKGCYVGQEVVSRMQHRGTARTRVVKVSGEGELPAFGTEITAGGKQAGTMGSHCGSMGLALVRLDRVPAGDGGGHPALAGSLPVMLEIPSWTGLEWPAET